MTKTQKSLNPAFTTLSLIFVTFLAGCATTSPPPSGFMGDYSMLRTDSSGDSSLQWWEKRGFNWQQYQKVMLDPVIIHYHPEARTKRINPEKEKRLSHYFRRAVEKELEGKYSIVTTPGPDVLRVRAAITEILPACPAINYPAMIVVLVPVDMGGAAIEAEFLDSQTNEVLAAMTDKKMGSPVKPRGFTTMGYTRAAFDAWAKELRNALQSNP